MMRTSRELNDPVERVLVIVLTVIATIALIVLSGRESITAIGGGDRHPLNLSTRSAASRSNR